MCFLEWSEAERCLDFACVSRFSQNVKGTRFFAREKAMKKPRFSVPGRPITSTVRNQMVPDRQW